MRLQSNPVMAMQSVCMAVLTLLFLDQVSTADRKPKCDTCKGIVDKFMEGVTKTQKSNFGGGNTHWEEKSLGKYEFSETRLIEITENLCGKKDSECHSMFEEYEELLEKWWFREYAKKTDTDLHSFFCINNVKACCPAGTYGPSCNNCPGGRTRPCKDNGKCEGDGTREGSGKCTCNSGYRGDMCDECQENYFEESKNDTHVSCRACHESCVDSCWEGGPAGCDECKAGWTQEDNTCIDVNECEADTPPCQENQFCKNTEGSFRCTACDVACHTCNDRGAQNCVECADLYFDDNGICKGCHKSCATSCSGAEATQCDACKEGWLPDDTAGCVDVDECQGESQLCAGNQYCLNNEGSYRCNECHSACQGCTAYGPESCLQCSPGFAMVDGVCQDMNECESGNACQGANEKCKNNPGSFVCVCKKNYIRKNDVCVKKPKGKKKGKKATAAETEDEEADDEATEDNQHQEL